ncbi:MAG: hypothetical protein Q9173_002338 [Seirophora scorigena]
MAALGHTIAVVDRSGKVVSTSKHLINVFKEAKAAYRERKAEIVAGRHHELQQKKARHALKAHAIDDDDLHSRDSRGSSRSKRSHRRPATNRFYSDSIAPSSVSSRPSPPPSPFKLQQDRSSAPSSPRALARRHTGIEDIPKSPSISRSGSSPCTIDMDLAYGEIPPPLEVARVEEEVELKGLINKVKKILDEAECLQYSATAIISTLQKDPEAMAAVALTLAEISNIASKMAPGALIALKGSAPAVFALLASPQFLIAAGVGVGITVVALGGYKIIKKIKAKHSEEDSGMDELLEIGGDVSRINNWRRGIAEVQPESPGTSVDGEFITPRAAEISRLNLNETAEPSSHRRSSRRSASENESSKGSNVGHSKHSRSRKEKGEKKGEKKEKKPSPLRLMFQPSCGKDTILTNKVDVQGKNHKIPMASDSRLAQADRATQNRDSLNALINRDDSNRLYQPNNDQEAFVGLVKDRSSKSSGPINGGDSAHSWQLEGNLSTAIRGELANQSHDSSKTGRQRNGSLRERENRTEEKDTVLRLSPAQIYDLTSSPDSLPRVAPAVEGRILIGLDGNMQDTSQETYNIGQQPVYLPETEACHARKVNSIDTLSQRNYIRDAEGNIFTRSTISDNREASPTDRKSSQVASTTPVVRKNSPGISLSAQNTMPSSRNSKSIPKPLNLDDKRLGTKNVVSEDSMPSPMPQTIPIPPYSLPTYLQLELSSRRPSPLYIHHSRSTDFPYESSRVKMERLQNFLRVPLHLEGVLWFGFFVCLDAWLSCFTILPLRFLKALGIIIQSVIRNVVAELKFIALSLYSGPGRVWRRRRASSATSPTRPSVASTVPATPKETPSQSPSNKSPQFSFPAESDNPLSDHNRVEPARGRKARRSRHQRAKSTPSALGPDNKADIVKGFLILVSCIILMQFDASRMYHGIRGQAAIKLYVIYNVLEVCDRLLSAIGQDVLECLISKEALERKPDGRSKIMRPFRLFLLALVYNLLHSSALFFQVITLNVAVNSYSNALLTLLMSNQFVEIKSTVFKKFEKENLFQLTCADVVERFQLWLMLTIIALRNLIETGGLTLGPASDNDFSPPIKSSIYPKAFTIFPTWAGLLFQPFLLVLGSEVLVDWLKHCYITKFNNTKPAIYGRFLDVFAKDYYTNAFANQNLTRRLGLPIIPLSCLFIRALVQTYHMFLATHLPPPVASTATSLSVDSTSTSPATTAAIQHIDHMFRRAIGRSTFGAASSSPISILHPMSWLHQSWSTDDIIALFTMLTFFLILFLCLLIVKLLLGMILLSYARGRYKGMKEREAESVQAEGRRVGGWGVVEVDEDKRRWIYMDDKEGAKRAREREERAREMQEKGGGDFGRVSYSGAKHGFANIRTAAPFDGHVANDRHGHRATDATDMSESHGEILDEPALFHKIRNERSILALAVSDARLFAGTQAGEISVWSLETYERIDSIKAHHRSVLSLYLSSDEGLLFSSGGDAIVNWYDLSDKDQRPKPDLSRHPLNRNHRFFDSKGPGGAPTPRPASPSQPRSHSGKQLEIDKTDILQYAHNGYTYCMLLFGSAEAAVFEDEVLISGGGDGTIKIWALDAEDGGSISELRSLESGDDSVLTLTIDGAFLYSGRSGGDVNVWDLETCQLVRRIESHHVDVLTLCVGHGSIFSGSANGLVKQFSPGYECLHEWQAHNQLILASLVTEQRGKRIYVTGGNDGYVTIWDIGRIRHVSTEAAFTDNDQLLQSLSQLVALRTVSSKREYAQECRRGASWLRNLFKNFGADTEMLGAAESRNPVVFAQFRGKGTSGKKRKRTLFYGHYDVVPAEDKQRLWASDPFEMRGLNGYLYGRGVSDNKGPVLAAIFAVAELVAEKTLSSDVVFLIEGEEECGSRGFQEVIQKNKDLVGDVDWILLANSYWLDDEIPCLTYGLRGVVHATVTIESGRSNLHSGVDGSQRINEAMKDLIGVLAVLSSNDGLIKIPGFYNPVLRLTPSEDEAYTAISKALVRRDPERGDSHELAEQLKGRWREPSLTIHRIINSDPTGSSVIPHSATATISIRLVPNQTTAIISEALKKVLRAAFTALKTPNQLSISIDHAAEPWLGDPGNKLFRTLEEAVVDVWGPLGHPHRGSVPPAKSPPKENAKLAVHARSTLGTSASLTNGSDHHSQATADSPSPPVSPKSTRFPVRPSWRPLFIREGGSIPAIRFLEQEFQAPAAHLPCRQASDKAHLDNERMRLSNLYKSKDIFKRIFRDLPLK